MNHPERTDLALYSGSDASLWTRLRVARHVKSCDQCRREVARYQTERQAARADADAMPAGLDWDSLSREMRANIHVGVAAAQCIAEAPVRRQWGFQIGKFAPTAAAVAVFFTGSWLIYTQSGLENKQSAAARTAQDRPANELVLRATMGGVEMRRADRALTLTYAGNGTAATVSVAGERSVNARYVDDESGQVTIHHVYAE